MEERQPLDVRAVRLGAPWTSLRLVDSVGSTNAELRGAPPGSVLVTEYQSAGRGRLDRSWVCPPRAGLMFSVALRPTAPAPRRGWLTLLAGLALAEAVPGSALKWPNDLLLAGEKAAGILATSSGADLIVGMGVNVSATREELPPGATSLALAGLPTDRAALLQAVLDSWGSRYRAWEAADGDAAACGLAQAYQGCCATLGQQVVVSGAVPVRGRATSVDELGRLVVGGVPVAVGDVRHVRPAAP